MHCIGVQGDAWPMFCSSCNTETAAEARHCLGTHKRTNELTRHCHYQTAVCWVCTCVTIAMTGWVHGVCVGACWVVSPQGGFSFSLFCNQALPLPNSPRTALTPVHLPSDKPHSNKHSFPVNTQDKAFCVQQHASTQRHERPARQKPVDHVKDKYFLDKCKHACCCASSWKRRASPKFPNSQVLT